MTISARKSSSTCFAVTEMGQGNKKERKIKNVLYNAPGRRAKPREIGPTLDFSAEIGWRANRERKYDSEGSNGF